MNRPSTVQSQISTMRPNMRWPVPLPRRCFWIALFPTAKAGRISTFRRGRIGPNRAAAEARRRTVCAPCMALSRSASAGAGERSAGQTADAGARRSCRRASQKQDQGHRLCRSAHDAGRARSDWALRRPSRAHGTANAAAMGRKVRHLRREGWLGLGAGRARRLRRLCKGGRLCGSGSSDASRAHDRNTTILCD